MTPVPNPAGSTVIRDSWSERADEAIRDWHRRHGTSDPADLPDPRLTLRERFQLHRENRAIMDVARKVGIEIGSTS